MTGDQHKHYQALAKIEWNGRHSSHCRLVHENDPTKSNNNEYIIGRNYENL